MKLPFLVAILLSLVHSGNSQNVEIDPCIIGHDVIVITDVRTDDEGKILELLNFFGEMADLVEREDTRFYVLGYPRIYTSSRTGSQTTTSTYLHRKHQVRTVQSFMQSSIDDRSTHPDFNVALRHVEDLLDNSVRSYAPKTVIIFSYNRYHPPITSSEEADLEEALETPSKVIMARLGESIKKKANVLIYAIGTFDNEFELYDLASCRDPRCIFKVDDFSSLSMSHVLKGCPAK
ncbi:uncharacterized protein LOC135481059 [Liolophura sinensis]|uniref:uncharacterized protein LOC135481059 n=1 Tax=Liolophura sinensis TaxID=3198878 RepID=UPI0031592F3E